MRATEIIRNLLDVIDSVESSEPAQEMDVEIIVPDAPAEEPNLHDEMLRFRQIADLMSGTEPVLANTPQERVAGIEAVTTDAGGGVNGPKHPADIRGDSWSMYPYLQYKPGE